MTDRDLIAEGRAALERHAVFGVVNLGQWTRENLPALLDALEAAQRPPLGYVTVDLQSENPPSLIEADREIASQQLADDRAASPLGDWVLLEVREVQP